MITSSRQCLVGFEANSAIHITHLGNGMIDQRIVVAADIESLRSLRQRDRQWTTTTDVLQCSGSTTFSPTFGYRKDSAHFHFARHRQRGVPTHLITADDDAFMPPVGDDDDDELDVCLLLLC